MDVQELRIGNLVCYRDKEWIPLFVSNLGNTFETVSSDNILYGSDDITEYKPIPLTKEWLLNFGFEKGKHAWFSKKYFTDCDEYAEVMKIDYNISSKRLAIYDDIEETDMVNILSHPIYTGKRVLYIHQLQNLYFALTGEELQLK